jgi:UDP-N-acetylglucosamine 1-carboxyvinyltransferase
MSYYEIEGGKALTGSVRLSGAKNLASKLILASLLTDKPCTLTNVPAIGEIDIAIQLVSLAGAQVERHEDSVTITAATVSEHDFHAVPVRNRLSILLIGPLLYRTGKALVPPVTGDQIGKRPVGFHIDALRALGVRIEQIDGGFQAVAEQLRGCEIQLPYPSVGATETVLLTASWATGITILKNAATEPEIVALVHFLRKMGAKIEIDEQARQITIEGVQTLSGAEQRVIPDRIEAVSYASAALATGGDIMLEDAQSQDLQIYLDFVRQIGGLIETTDAGIRIANTGSLHSASFETAVHPGFMTDWQQPSVVVLCMATGKSYLHETVFEDRLRYTADLVRMGATIEVSTDCYGTACRFAGQNHRHSATIEGPTTFKPTTLHIPDIRAGMAHVVASLVATGTSRLYGIEHLDRGFGRSLEDKLRGLGAVIRRIEE